MQIKDSQKISSRHVLLLTSSGSETGNYGDCRNDEIDEIRKKFSRNQNKIRAVNKRLKHLSLQEVEFIYI